MPSAAALVAVPTITVVSAEMALVTLKPDSDDRPVMVPWKVLTAPDIAPSALTLAS